MKKSSTNLTEGNITSQILLFALPILLGQIFQNLYNSVDAIVVGRNIGTTALAAVSSCSDISHLIVGFFTGLSTGAGVLFSRCFGAGDHERLHKTIHTALTFSLIIGTAMAAIGIVISPLLLKIVDCPDDVYPEAMIYLRIYLVGVLFTAIYNVGSGVLRSVGDSRHPFIYLVISSLVNIVLDILLVAVIPMGVAGTAIATVISQVISVVLVFTRMLKTEDVYKLVIRDLKIDKEILKEVLNLGLPAAIQAALTSISNLFVSRYINGFGSAAMAGMGAGKKIDKFASMVAQSLGLAVATFVGQNVGAKKFERAFKGIRTALVTAIAYLIGAGVIIYINADFFVKIFTDDPEAMQYGIDMIHTMMPLYVVQAFNNIFANATRGFGKSRVVMYCSLVGMIGCRQIFLAITMSISHNVTNIYYGYPVGWFFAGLTVFIYYWFNIHCKHEEARIIRKKA